jgi:hypothetical protein
VLIDIAALSVEQDVARIASWVSRIRQRWDLTVALHNSCWHTVF